MSWMSFAGVPGMLLSDLFWPFQGYQKNMLLYTPFPTTCSFSWPFVLFCLKKISGLYFRSYRYYFSDNRSEMRHSGAFQIIEIQNFLQPWWRYSVINVWKCFILEHWRSSKSKIFFSHCEDVIDLLRSFILEPLRSPQLKKNSTMTKEQHPNILILIKSFIVWGL